MQQHGHALLAAVHAQAMVFACVIGADGADLILGDAVFPRLAPHLIHIAPHGDDDVRLALHLVAGRVAEADVYRVDEIDGNIALDGLTGLERRIKMNVEAGVSVYAGVLEQRTAERLDARAFDGGGEGALEHMGGAAALAVHLERRDAHGHIIRHEHRHEQVDAAAQHIEDQRIERLHAQPLPLSAEVEGLVAAHTVVQTDRALVIVVALISAPDLRRGTVKLHFLPPPPGRRPSAPQYRG